MMLSTSAQLTHLPTMHRTNMGLLVSNLLWPIDMLELQCGLKPDYLFSFLVHVMVVVFAATTDFLFRHALRFCYLVLY